MSLKFKMSKRYIILILLFSVANLVFSSQAFGQSNNENTKQKKEELKIYSDEFSELDEVPLPHNTKDPVVLKTLEKSRQKYLQALMLIEKKDTINAAKYFEGAINILNQLVSYPNIEKNRDFTDLAQAIIEDYESNIKSIDNLDDNSSLFIFRDKLFQEIDVAGSSKKTKIQSIDLHTADSLAGATTGESNEFQIPLDDNIYVQKSIDFLTKDKFGRRFLKKCFERQGKWGPMLQEIIAEEEMPRELIYLAMVESGLNPTVVSRAKAVGMWQFIRSTGKNYGLNADDSPWVDERKDPVKATRASMRHLKDLHNSLGDWHLALASYNYGMGGVKRSIRRSKLENPDFWALRKYLPKETRNYVPLFIAIAKVFSNPEEYDIDVSEFDIMEEFTFDTLTINEAISLKALAQCANITVDEFLEYNTELISSCTPPNVKEYTIRIPEGTRTSFTTLLSTLTPEEKQPWVTYKVGRRETFRSIAKKYDISPRALASANNMRYTKKRLKRGLKLKIPVDKTTKEEEQPAENLAKTNTHPVVGDTSAGFIMHSVVPGETIYSIANKYSIRIADLRNLNNIPYNVEVLEPGTQLKIAQAKTSQNQTAQHENAIRPVVVKHKVAKGETLAQIADDYKVSVNDIRTWNRLESQPKAGQYLKIISNNANTVEKAEKTKSSKNISVKKTPKKKYSSTKTKKVYHKVRKGENLSNIAAKYGVTEKDIKRWNPSKVKGNTIYYGSKLKIYPERKYKGSSKSKRKKVKTPPKYYKVRWGDTLQRISRKFGVSVKTLKRKNKNLSNKNLKAGQRIRIQ